MTVQPTNSPGWYDDGTGQRRWFDGAAWGRYESVCPNCGTPFSDETFCGQCGSKLTALGTASVVSQSAAASVHSAPAVIDDAPVVVRRSRRNPFIAPSPEQAGEVSGISVSRNWSLGLRSATAKKGSGMTRNRKIAGDLPEWSPLPPGELSVDRTGGNRR